eukprot:TRINITY_DN749_c0_g2_i3.p1 TRINITY_DN749_c0_g2~~TRINITY_DN749_c0_g2_i3.p1  ORF type:complete len:771 (+),score=132.61 TRINITY_DN749_c0_g2_i3:203-2515(+)
MEVSLTAPNGATTAEPTSQPTAPVTFKIAVTIAFGETVHLCGDCPELGNWNPRKSVPLQTSPDTFPLWTATVDVPTRDKVEYRYIIKYGRGVRRWETLDKNRSVSFSQSTSASSPVAVAGRVRVVVNDGTFGEEVDKQVWIDRGWLTDGVQLNLSLRRGKQSMVELTKPIPYNLKLRPLDPQHETSVGTFALQKSLERDDLYIFYAPDPKLLSFEVEVWSLPPPTDGSPTGSPRRYHPSSAMSFLPSAVVASVAADAYLIGKTIVLSHKIKNSCAGNITRPLFNHALEMVGTFMCSFVVITPFLHPDNNLSYLERAKFMRAKQAAIHIGHRGSGANKKYSVDSDSDGGDFDNSVQNNDNNNNPASPGIPNPHRRASQPVIRPPIVPTVLPPFKEQLPEESLDEDEEKEGEKEKEVEKNAAAVSNNDNVKHNRKGEFAKEALPSASPAKTPSKTVNLADVKNLPIDKRLASTIAENTLLSFVTAATIGADYIEFDVQLTKDSIPVICHDLQLQIPTETIDSNQIYVKVPVNKVMYKKFRQLRRFVPQERNYNEIIKQVLPQQTSGPKFRRTRSFEDMKGEYWSSTHGVELSSPYTTLQETLQAVPEHVGFDVEIKYPESEKSRKSLDYFDRNHVLNTILKVLFDYAGKRPIFISSFDPDLCMMCCLKQPRYPVFLLTEGGACGMVYEDERRNTLDGALKFSKEAHLRGVAPWTRALLPDLDFVKRCHDAGLLLFTWGADNNEKGPVEQQKTAGVDAIISDNILHIKPRVVL